MTKLVLIDDDLGFVEQFKTTWAPLLGERSEIVHLYPEGLVETYSPEVVGLLREAEIILVDLELKGRDDGPPADLLGLEFVLPRVRQAAPWVPTFLMSAYLVGEVGATILPLVSVDDFDGLVAKRFVKSKAATGADWADFKRRGWLRRLAAVTGRPLGEVRRDAARAIEFDPGALKDEVEALLRADVEKAIALLGLDARAFVVDELVQGFGGVLVAKLSCSGEGRRSRWLLKIGRNLPKIWEEASNHRAALEQGLTRHLVLPLLRPAPVWVGSLGAIAYEFEEGASTLREWIDLNGPEAGLEKIAPALRELFGSKRDAFVSTEAVLRRHLGGIPGGSLSVLGPSIARFVEGISGLRRIPELLASVELRTGLQHCDMHCRNVLIDSRGEPVFVDFAKYERRVEKGVPLVDVARLLVDLAVFCRTWLITTVVAKEFLDREEIRRFLSASGALLDSEPSKGEKAFLAWSIWGFFVQYLAYDDIGEGRRFEIISALENAGLPIAAA